MNRRWPLLAMLLAPALAAFGVSGCRFVVGVDDRELGRGGAGAASSGACGDVQSDPHNCGVCSHDCLGGECGYGSCQPFLVAQTPSAFQQQGLVADPGPDGNIYWGKFQPNGALFSVPKSGGDATTLATLPDGGWLYELATDGDALYFTNFSDSDRHASRGIYSVQLDGSSLKQLAGGGVLGTSSVATRNGSVFYLNSYDELAIGRVPTEGGSVVPILQLPHDDSPALYNMQGGIVVDDEWIYYSYVNPDDHDDDGIFRVRQDGSAKGRLFRVPDGGLVRGLHDGELYWNQNDGKVYHGPIDGSAEGTSLAASSSNLVFHDGYIYAQRGPDVVRYREHVPSPKEELVWFGDAPWPLTTDGVSLIWVEHYQGGVYRLAF